jgi:hypothetical protein
MAGFNVKKRTLYDTTTAGITTTDGNPLTSFGELSVSELTPTSQGDFIYGINNIMFSSGTFAGGTVSASNGFGIAKSGTSTSGSATLYLRRNLKYRPGMGSLMRATCLFDTPVTNNNQLLGLGNIESGYYFGYVGTNFGIIHEETAQAEIRKLTVTSGVGTTSVTVTLDGISVSVPVTGGSDISQTSYQLGLYDYSGVGAGWRADVIDSIVYFTSARAAPYTGSFSFVSGTFSTVQSGVTPTRTFISQSTWNIDRLDGGASGGPNPSRMVINPQKGNVYQIGFQYLGFGNAFFAVEDPELGRMTPVHMIKNANNRTNPVLKNPQVAAKLISENSGSTTNVQPKSASMAIFTEGMVKKLDPRFAKSVSFVDLSSTSDIPLMAIKVNQNFNNKQCFGEFDILRIAASNTSTSGKSMFVSVYRNLRISGDVDFQYIDQNNSIVSIATLDTDLASPANTVSTNGFNPFLTFAVGAGAATTVDIEPEELIFNVGDIVVICAKATGNKVDTGVIGINWFEQQ